MRTPGKVAVDTEGVIFSQEDGINICSMYPFNRAANAQFLALAWNLHDELVAALEGALRHCGSCGGSGIAYTMNNETEIGQPLGSSGIDCPECCDIRSALAKAKEAPDEKA